MYHDGPSGTVGARDGRADEMRRRKIIMILAVAVSAIVLSVLAVEVYRHPYLRRRRVAALIQSYQADPSLGTARVLVRTLNLAEADMAQGRRILQLLARPRVTTRQAYRTDWSIGIRVEQSKAAHLLRARPDVVFKTEETIHMFHQTFGGKLVTEGRSALGHFLWGAPPYKPGRHQFTLSCKARHTSSETRDAICWPSAAPTDIDRP